MEKHEAAVMKLMAAPPSNPKKLAKAARKNGNIELEDGECIAMVVSGSSLHAFDADIDIPCPSLERSVVKTDSIQQRLHVGQFSNDLAQCILNDMLTEGKST